MSNRSKAQRSIELDTLCMSTIQGAIVAVDSLDRLGLLMPDLPEPNLPDFEGGAKWDIGPNASVITDDLSKVIFTVKFDSHIMRIETARNIALALLAAANEAEARNE